MPEYIAQGWILYRPDKSLVKQETYEIDRLLETAPRYGYKVEVVNPDELSFIIGMGGKPDLFLRGQHVDTLPDFVIPRMGSTTSYFALAVLRHLEKLGIYSLNSSTAVALAQDKLLQLQKLSDAGLPVPKTILVQFPVNIDLIEKEIGFPTVVKTRVGTQGSGVHLCDTRQALNDLLQFVEANNPDAELFLQQFVPESRGRDVRVLSIGGLIVGAMERKAAEGFKSNYSQGGSAMPFEYGPKNELAVADTMKVLGMDMAGLDYLYDDEVGMRILEVNSSPGFEGLEKTCKVDVAAAVFRFLDVKLKFSNKYKARVLGWSKPAECNPDE
ncbi:MAG: RimK family alpha-L-glutamate ligase [Thermodesulfobacteria bacterium]|nr:RimK family alpha-L-glutamate ligase [Thermodesulfobacteriota bacterium]